MGINLETQKGKIHHLDDSFHGVGRCLGRPSECHGKGQVEMRGNSRISEVAVWSGS
jgi:hypothetical protein